MSEHDIDLEILKSKRKLKWLIDGWFIHCIPTYLWSDLAVERIIELYNVDINYFIKPKQR